MRSAYTRACVNRILTTLLQPRCALCDEDHRLADRVCYACKMSIANAERVTGHEGLRTGAQSPCQRRKDLKAVRSSRVGAKPHNETFGALDMVVSAFNYQGAIPDLITRWKYRGMIELTDYIAECVAELIARRTLSIPKHNLVTVVPSHWQRRLARGFDPVWLLANSLAKKGVIDKPVSTLKPSRMMPYQHLKSLNDRQIDSDHFRVTKPVMGKKILIIDDVVTSGATLRAAAIALKAANAQSVLGLTIASANTGFSNHGCTTAHVETAGRSH